MAEPSTDLPTMWRRPSAGPPERRRAWNRRLRSAPALHLPARRTVVVVPHPDDEALSSGGLIMHQMGRGVPVVAVAVTDGDAASTTWPEPGLAATRREEQRISLSILGVAAAATVRLGLPDGALAAHGETLVELLLAIVQPGDVVVAPWAHDLHPDHVACGHAAQLVARAHRCTLLGSMFWALHHIDPRDHPDIGFAALVLTDDECLWRQEALHSHASQFDRGMHAPIFDESLLDPLRLPVERYVVAS